MDQTTFASRIITYCQAMGASVTSWGRTPLHNQRVGGVPNSAHLHFFAADVVYDNTPDEHTRATCALGLELKLITEEDHDHLEPVVR